jgi:hypothetical protein
MAKKSVKERSTQELLLENFINLQKKLAEAVKETRDLNAKVSELVDIFKKAEHDISHDPKITFNPEIETKLEELSDQNKAIIDGIVAVGESIKSNSNIQEKIQNKLQTMKAKKTEKKPKKEKEEEEEQESKDEDIEVEKDDEGEENKDDNYNLEPLPEFNF